MAEHTAARDRRSRLVIYALLIVLIALGLLFPNIIKNAVATEAMQAYQLVDSAAGGGFVFLVHDSASPEGQRQLTAILRQAISSGALVVAASTSQAGAAEVERVLRSQLASSRRQYGQAAINLGWRPGGTAYLDSLGRGLISAAQGRDHAGEDLELLQLAYSFRTLDQADVLAYTAGEGAAAVRSAQSLGYSNSVPVLVAASGEEAGGTAVQFWQEGRIDAVLAGNRATSDYESLVAGRGSPSRYLTAVTLGTLFLMALIIWAYLGGFIARRRQS